MKARRVTTVRRAKDSDPGRLRNRHHCGRLIGHLWSVMSSAPPMRCDRRVDLPELANKPVGLPVKPGFQLIVLVSVPFGTLNLASVPESHIKPERTLSGGCLPGEWLVEEQQRMKQQVGPWAPVAGTAGWLGYRLP